MIAFSQTTQPLVVKASHPIDEGAGRVAKQSGHLFATHARGHQQHAVQPVIVAGVLMTVDLLLQHSAAVLRQ